MSFQRRWKGNLQVHAIAINLFLVGSKASAIEGSLHVPSIVFGFIFMAVKSHVLRAFVDLVHVCPSERKNARKCILNYSSTFCMFIRITVAMAA